MKKSLSELKSLVQEHKRNLPKLNAGKSLLYKYATENNLLEKQLMDAVKEDRKEKHDTVMRNRPIETEKPVEEVKSKKPKKEEVIETTYHEEVKKATKQKEIKPYTMDYVSPPSISKKKVKEVKEEVKESVKKPKSISLSAVQALKKEKGITLKEAWALFKSQN
jgi:hypothetical protein